MLISIEVQKVINKHNLTTSKFQKEVNTSNMNVNRFIKP